MGIGRNAETTGKGKQRIRILLVDDHPLVREGLAGIINREADLMVCGEAEDRSEAMKVVEAQQPSLVIVDLTLKSSSGLDLIKDIHSRWPNLKMLVLSMHDGSLYAERALRAGAAGYICKEEAIRKLRLAIRHVLAGGIYLNKRIATQNIQRPTIAASAAAADFTKLLANRELQVFELTGRGLSSQEIAIRLHIAKSTVETYRARILDKLKLRDGSELLRLAICWAHKH
jgi:DNA-binding NarL/FixJ family response regulator